MRILTLLKKMKIGEIVKKFKLELQKPSVDEVQQWIEKA